MEGEERRPKPLKLSQLSIKSDHPIPPIPVAGRRLGHPSGQRDAQPQQPHADRHVLDAGRMGLHEAMKRFDAIRGKAVANEGPMEHRPVGHEQNLQSDKPLVN
jgi:hypothetical protein